MKNSLKGRYFLISFLITFCIVTIFSFLTLVSNSSREVLNEQSGISKNYIPTSSHDLTVLLIGEGEGRGYCLVKLCSEEMKLYAISLPSQMKINSRSLSDTQTYGGARFLKDELSAFLGVEIDRFVRVREKMFVKILDTLGAMPLKTEDDIYSFENAFSLSKGEHILPFEKVLGVIKYDTEKGEESRLNRQTRVLCEIFNEKINDQKIPSAEDFFNMAVNLIDTDISVFDFDLRRGFADEFLKNGEAVALDVFTDDGFNLTDQSKSVIKARF